MKQLKLFAALVAAATLCGAMTAPVSAAPAYQKGDINMDGEVGPEDAMLALIEYTEYLIAHKPHTLTDEQLELADVDGEALGFWNRTSPVTCLDASYILIFYTEGVANSKLIGTDIQAWIPDCPIKFVPVDVETDGIVEAQVFSAHRE